ncbi:MAG: PorV/PorQ family protein [Bacteroidia bacterium]
MRRLVIFSYLFFLCIHFSDVSAQILPSFGNSRTGTSGMQFLKIGPDARGAGMSGAYHSVVNDVSALYWNPAGITHSDSQRYQMQFGQTQYFAKVKMSYGGFVYRASPYRFWGFHVINLSTPDMPVTTEWNPTGTGQTYRVNNTALGISYAQVLTDNFSFGLTGKYAYEGIAGISTHNVLFDLGLQYYVGWQDIRFSVGLNNFGVNVQPTGEIKILSLRGEEEKNSFESFSAPALFRVGVAKDFINKNNHLLTTAIQLNHPTDNNETFGLGAEYSFKKRFYARTGYEFGQDENGWPSLGAGVKWQRYFGNLSLDYSINNKNNLGNIHRITLGVSLK